MNDGSENKLTNSEAPTVSVVMGVYNAERTVAAAIRGILDQDDPNFELIVIVDGSTDQTANIVTDLSQADSRIRVVSQANTGLTRALILGCQLSRGRYIMRQDADDHSLPPRIRLQVAALDQHPEAPLATCWVEDVTPEGVVTASHQTLEHPLKHLSKTVNRTMVGIPAHGSVMLRRTALEAVGGYRDFFYYAQDSDLWLRLSELGSFVVVPQVLYRRTVASGSISMRFSKAQARFCELAQESHRALVERRSDAEYRSEAERLTDICRENRLKPTSRRDEATSLLLLAAQLHSIDPPKSRELLRKALGRWPFHLRTWKALLLGWRRDRSGIEKS